MKTLQVPLGILAFGIMLLLGRTVLLASPTSAQGTSATIVLQPNSGPPGTLVTVRGSGFPGGAQVQLFLAGVTTFSGGGPEAQVYASGYADPYGSVTLGFMIPSLWPDGRPVQPGALQVLVSTVAKDVNATTTFAVTSAQPTLTPTPVVNRPAAMLSPDRGPAGMQVLVRGGGFAPYAPLITLLGKFDGQINADGAQVYASTSADARGDYQMSFTMPSRWADGQAITTGPVLVVVTTPGLDQQAAAPFTYEGAAVATPPVQGATALIQPDAGPPGTAVTIWGGGFPANHRVTAHLAGLVGYRSGGDAAPAGYAAASTDASGNYFMTMSMPARWPDGTPLRPGAVTVFVSTDDNAVRASTTFTYAGIPPTPTPTPPMGSQPQNAWRGYYWANPSLSGRPAFSRIDPAIDFDWRNDSPALGFPADNFSVRWTSEQQFERGLYRFTLEVDDGARLIVGNQMAIDEWRVGSRRTVQNELTLPGGTLPVRVEYFEATGDAGIKLGWEYLGSTPPIRPTATPTRSSTFFDDAPWNNQRNVNSYFCSGFESECDYANCPPDYRLVWALYCRETDYPYVETGQYRVTIYGEGRARIGATDYGAFRNLFALGEYEAVLPASFEFCWEGLQPGGTGFETVVQSLGTYAKVDRIRIEQVSDQCR
jgi:hypothetical protein